MTVQVNKKTITENRFVGALLMAIGVIVLSLISNGFMALFSELAGFLAPRWFEPGLITAMFIEMWMGGIIGLMGFFVIFGRSGSSFWLNQVELEAVTEKNWHKRRQIEKIVEVLNMPNLGKEGVITEIISVLDLEITEKNGWQKKGIANPK